jgi:LacI family transcriptional regulator
MTDVAKLAGVSMKSVSRVINREPNVTGKLREKVESAVATLGYVPDFAARSLAGGRSFTLGLLFSDYSDPIVPSYYLKAQNGASRACREYGYHLLVESVPTAEPDFAARFERTLSTMRTDGFILPPPLADDDVIMEVLERKRIPFARIAPSIDLSRSPCVVMDDEAAARDVARHLWECGHRRFGFVSGRADHPAAHQRRKGFASALAELGSFAFSEAEGRFQFDDGIEAARQLMAAPTPPTAIFAANDDSAAGVMAGLAQLGLKVPDDVSVTGFDDSWIALSIWPNLTTIHQPIAEMAAAAATMLIERRGGEEPKPAMVLDYHLVVRESVAPPKTIS